jgi:predicted nuclease with TOPRIM domain
MDALTRLAEQVERLLAAHGRAQETRRALEGALHERERQARQLEERQAQALRRIQELEQERGRLRERLAALPDEASLEEARARLARLLEGLDGLEDGTDPDAGRGHR